MAQIRIREQAREQDGSFKATVGFEGGEEYPITIQNPFSQKEEQVLEWYFEEYLEFPFVEQVRANQAGGSVTRYGEKLFEQVFADREAFARYKEYVQDGLNNLQIEIAGNPGFHALHWEALKNPKSPTPLAVQVPMVRKNLTPLSVRAKVRRSPTINLLVVTARPFGKYDAAYRMVSRPLVEGLRKAQLPVQVDILRPGTYRALIDHLEEARLRLQQQGGDDEAEATGGYYHVIHFDVHGALLTHEQLQKGRAANRYLFQSRHGRADIAPYEGYKAFLFLEGEGDEPADPVEAGELANLLQSYQIPIAILNACQSGKQVDAQKEGGQAKKAAGGQAQAGQQGNQGNAGEPPAEQIEVRETSLGSRLMQAGTQVVLAMGYSVTVSAAELMMRTLYEQLFDRRDLLTAIRRARQQLYNDKNRQAYFNQVIELEDWLLPVAYQNQPVALRVRDFTPEEAKTFYESEANRYEARQPQYGFLGRDLDILQLEKRLLTRRNLVLVRGMGGAGKTTLLQHLGEWWQRTGLVKQVFYFGYDEKAWNRQQLLDSLARSLLGPAQYAATFQSLSLDAGQKLLSQRLRSERHLLILDNLESITGQHLAIQHTLPPEEQQALQRLLRDLAGGRTLVLLGSRSAESWLAEGTFGDNLYDLGGLDPEAASMLADRILERHHVTKYRQDPDVQHLLKLLDGFPLALEVVLANLTRQTPKEVLTALQSGGVDLNTGDSQERTKNILRCIDYSHSNLSPAAQQLLLCLAPFTSVIFEPMLKQYTAQLRQQPLLSALPFDRWPEVLHEAENWGLLSRDPNIPGFLPLQPTLPYFLRNRLQAPEQAARKHAIETAFREHYDEYADELHQLQKSKEPRQRQLGQVLTQLEYENLMTALQLALADQVSILNSYRSLSNYLDATHDHQRGLELGQTVLSALEKYPAEKLAGQLGSEFAGVIDDIAKRQLMLKRYPEAEISYQKALTLLLENKGSEAKTIKKLSALIYHNLGIVAQGQRKWEQAGHYYHQALQIFIEYQDRYSQAGTYHQLGSMAEDQRQWKQAEKYYQQALQIYIEYQDRYSQARAYHQLGVVAQEQKQRKQAERYYQQALQIYIEYQDRYEQANTSGQLGRVAQEQKQWEQAGRYYQQALQIFIEYGNLDGQAKTYHNLGIVSQEQREWEQAEQYYQQALQIKIEYQDRYSQANTYHQLGQVAQEQRQWEQAGDYFLRALETYVAYDDDYGRGIALGSLARLWRASGDGRVVGAVAKILGMSSDEVEKVFRGDGEGGDAEEGE